MADEKSLVDLTPEELEEQGSFWNSMDERELLAAAVESAGYSLPVSGNALSAKDYYNTAKKIASGKAKKADFISLPLDVLGMFSPIRLRRPPNKSNIVIGENNATLTATERKSLAEAKRAFESYGRKKAGTVTQEHGWAPLPHDPLDREFAGNLFWTKEIADRKAALKPEQVEQIKNMLLEATKPGFPPGSVLQIKPLEDFISHDNLFSRYPELAKGRVLVDPADVSGGAGAMLSPNDFQVRLSGNMFSDTPKRTKPILSSMIHELQHGVAGIESNRSFRMNGMLMDTSALRPGSWGGDTIGMSMKAGPDGSVPYNEFLKYAQNRGEMLARLTEQRAKLTPADLEKFNRFRAMMLQQRLLNKQRRKIEAAPAPTQKDVDDLYYSPEINTLSVDDQFSLLKSLLEKE